MVNQTKQKIMTNKLEEDNNDAIQGKQNNNKVNHWVGEFSIPSTWLEGGTETFQRSGSYSPSGDQTTFSLRISYKLTDGKICTASFNSADAFHWSVPRQING